ncbi:MAG: hypothetical protein RQ735_07320 [Flavobacteriaceae bacterium]|nr:hypothetical protein [Flavobacteriaceae bacterium]
MESTFFKSALLFFGILFVSASLHAQDSEVEKIYTNFYKQPREKVVVHLNKTVFLPGESIWFQAHLLDPRFDHASLLSSNVYAGLYDLEGKLVSGDVFFTDNGIANGQLAIDENFTAQEYVLHIFTNWSLNFDKGHVFTQNIRIARNDHAAAHKTYHPEDYYLKLNTEGNAPLLADAQNRIVYALTDLNGLPVSFQKGELVNSKQQVVNTFQGNKEGLGEFQFWLDKQETYTAKFYIEGDFHLTQALPDAQSSGIQMQLNTLLSDKIGIVFQSHNMAEKATNPYQLAIVKDGYIFTKKIAFEEGKAAIFLEKNDLPHGVNTLYLLDNDNILLERKFMNRPAGYLPTAAVSLDRFTADSLYFSLKTYAPDETFVFSASALPANTVADADKLSFLKQNFLRTYASEGERNMNPRLIDGNRIDNYGFDLFLLTQISGAKTWQALYGTQPAMDYDFEKGLTISGKLDISAKKAEKYALILFTENLGFQQKLDINPDGSFVSYHNYLEKNTELNLGLTNRNDFMIRPDVDNINILPNTEHTLQKFPYAVDFAKQTLEPKTNGDKIAIKIDEIPDIIALNETEVSAETPKSKTNIPGQIGSSVETQRYVIDPEDVKLNFYVFDFLRTKGYWVSLNNTPGTPTIRSQKSGGGIPTIFINNVQIIDFSILNRMPLYEVAEIYINHSGLGYGARGGSDLRTGGGGVINIFMREGADFSGFSSPYSNQQTVKIVNGFSPSKKYEAPKYKVFDSGEFVKFGVLDWIPQLQTDPTGEVRFVIARNRQEAIKLVIEGVSSAGNMISIEEVFNITGQ